MEFKAIKLKDRLPNFNQRIFFFNSSYGLGYLQNKETTFIKEYNPMEEIEFRKGQFIFIKDCEKSKEYLINNFTHWLELKKDSV